jgi:hypothetical protein
VTCGELDRQGQQDPDRVRWLSRDRICSRVACFCTMFSRMFSWVRQLHAAISAVGLGLFDGPRVCPYICAMRPTTGAGFAAVVAAVLLAERSVQHMYRDSVVCLWLPTGPRIPDPACQVQYAAMWLHSVVQRLHCSGAARV